MVVKGFKRWIALGLAVLAVLVAVSAFVFRVDILPTALDPKVPVQAYPPPKPPTSPGAAASPGVGRAGAIFPWASTGRFLGRSIEEYWRAHPLREQLGWWEAAGIGTVHTRTMSNGAAIETWGLKR